MICLITSKYGLTIQPLPRTVTGNRFSKIKVGDLESRLWLEFCSGHPNMHVEQACSENVSPSQILVLSRPLPGFGQLSSYPNQTYG